jgi:hypothetical protein
LRRGRSAGANFIKQKGNKGVRTVHTLLLIVAGLALMGVLSAVLEGLGMRNHPLLAKLLAGVLVLANAYTHAWLRLLLITCAAVLYLTLRREWKRRNLLTRGQ